MWRRRNAVFCVSVRWRSFALMVFEPIVIGIDSRPALLAIGGRMANDCEPAQKWQKTANRPLTEPLCCAKLVTIKCVDGDK